MAEKNMIIALVLSFIITGLGLAYDGLYVRAIVSFVIGVVCSLLSYYVSVLFGIIGFIWTIYIIYDTYQCTDAINNNTSIPKYLTQFDLE